MPLTPAEQVQKQYEDLAARMASVEKQLSMPPSHFHNGFDSNNISWVDIASKKIYVQHTIIDVAAATAANYGVFWIIPAPMLLVRVREVHQTAGTDAGAVTLTLEKLTGTQAPDSGVSMLSGTINLKGTANTVVTPTVTTTNANKTLAIGDRLCMKDAGVLTSVANVTILAELQMI